MSNNVKTNRIEGLDLIRAIAICGVICNHCFQCIFPINDIDYFNNISTISKMIYFGCYSTSAVSVPLFFIISGYLLLSREYDEVSTKKFYKHNFLPLLITWEMWIPLNNWLAWWFYDIPFHISTLLKNMLFIESVYIGHSWYMPVILGIYLFIPYVSRTLKTMSTKELLPIYSIAFLYYLIVPTLNRLRLTQWDICLDLSFSGGMYGMYIILGYLIKRYENQLKSSIKFFALAVVSIALLILLQMQIYLSTGQIFKLWYDVCFFLTSAMGIFIILKDVKLNKFRSLIKKISQCSFGMYLIHVFVIAVFLKYGILNFIVSDGLRIMVLTLVVYILSFALAVSIKNIPYIGKILVR